MHAILFTMGTDGDVFPYVGLGASLRGRAVLLARRRPDPFSHEHLRRLTDKRDRVIL
jgi:hypothetical protein